jgi:hypothetical protein
LRIEKKFGTPYEILTGILNLLMKNLIRMGPHKKMCCGDFVYEKIYMYSRFVGCGIDLKNMGKIQEKNHQPLAIL